MFSLLEPNKDLIKKRDRENLPRDFALGMGFGCAMIDLVASGAPLLTLGLFWYDLARSFGLDDKKVIKYYLKNSVYYALGASIPFAIYYQEEISDVIYQTLDFLL